MAKQCPQLLVCAVWLLSVTVRGADADTVATERVLLQLNAQRGLAGQPVATAQAPVLVPDPRTANLAEWLRAGGLGSAPIPTAAASPRTAASEPRQRAAWQRLLRAAGPGVEVHLRRENGTVRQVRGLPPGSTPLSLANGDARTRAEAAARGFLRAQAELFRVQDPDREWVLERSEPDGLDGRTVRFTQRHGTLPVWPATVAVHVDHRGDVVVVDGAYIPTPADTATEPLLTAAAAVDRARAGLAGAGGAEAGTPELMVYAPLDAEPRLGWRFPLNLGLARAWQCVVDARDGRILRGANAICDAGVTGTGTDMEGASQTLSVWQTGGTHFLIDTSKQMFRPGSDPVQKPEGTITIADARLKKVNELQGSDIFLITSANANDWPIADGVSAAFNFSKTYDYFLGQHGRNSLDGNGGNITAVVRVGEYDNASWNGNLKLMLFGTVKPYPKALDVVGHELTHGLTESSAGLVYELQSGALNEAFSDIFGEMVEAFVVGQPDWKLGTKLGKVFRDFQNPGSLTIGGLNRPYPSRMSEFVQLANTDDADHGGVHINSSIINHCYWLLAEGLPGAVGRRDAERIFFRTLTQHLQQQSQFIDARLGAVAAAEALFGASSTQARKVAEAFDAVEILAAPETPDPTPVPVVQGPDSSLFVTQDPFFGSYELYRRESTQGDPAFGSLFSASARLSRPAVTGNGEVVLLVNADNDLCLAETANPAGGQCFGFAGQVHAVAVSPDSRMGAFVFRDASTGQPDNRINLIDLNTGTSRTVELLAPSVDGVPIDGVLYADSMVFSSDSQVLIYDALSRVRFGSGPTVERWSIYALNVATGKISIVVPPIDGVDTGNPSMGRAGNRYLTLDALVEATGDSIVFVVDLFTGQASRVGQVSQGLGYPVFTGDESAVVFAGRDPNAFVTGFSLYRQTLADDRLTTVGNAATWIEDARLGVVYRRGAFVGTNAAPTVTLTSPAPGTTLAPGVPVSLTANAVDADGTIARVEFYDGDTRLGDDAAAPYGFTWTPATAGAHRLIARAVDNLGGSGDSAAIAVTVGNSGGTAPQLAIAVRPDGSMRLTVRGTAGGYVLEQSSDLRQWSGLADVTVAAGGEGSVDDPPVPGRPARFYRARRP